MVAAWRKTCVCEIPLSRRILPPCRTGGHILRLLVVVVSTPSWQGARHKTFVSVPRHRTMHPGYLSDQAHSLSAIQMGCLQVSWIVGQGMCTCPNTHPSVTMGTRQMAWHEWIEVSYLVVSTRPRRQPPVVGPGVRKVLSSQMVPNSDLWGEGGEDAR